MCVGGKFVIQWVVPLPRRMVGLIYTYIYKCQVYLNIPIMQLFSYSIGNIRVRIFTLHVHVYTHANLVKRYTYRR